jgi:glycosyltransferase involved in cell wall biosynthesis
MDLLIEAFADLRQRHDARLLIVGQGPERSHADMAAGLIDETMRRLTADNLPFPGTPLVAETSGGAG